MARIFRSQDRSIDRPLALLLALLFGVVTNARAMAQLYDQPILIVDPGMRTALLWLADADSAGRLGVTGCEDKTIRVWSLTDGKLLYAG